MKIHLPTPLKLNSNHGAAPEVLLSTTGCHTNSDKFKFVWVCGQETIQYITSHKTSCFHFFCGLNKCDTVNRWDTEVLVGGFFLFSDWARLFPSMCSLYLGCRRDSGVNLNCWCWDIPLLTNTRLQNDHVVDNVVKCERLHIYRHTWPFFKKGTVFDSVEECEWDCGLVSLSLNKSD